MGFLIAAMQDLKRREVDNWLNLFLFFSGFLYILFKTFYYSEVSFLINFAFLTFFMFGLIYLFYFSRVFAGGDCKLLFASTPILVSFDFIQSFQNVLIFSVLILFLGAVYGLIWILGLFIKDFNKNCEDFSRLIRKNFMYIVPVILFLFLGFIHGIFFGFFVLLVFLIFVFLISKVVEKNSLVREVYSRDLREGDWLDKSFSFNGKNFKYSFGGLSLNDVKFLKGYKKKISVKDGIPFAPVFLFSWIVFYFQGIFIELIFGFLSV